MSLSYCGDCDEDLNRRSNEDAEGFHNSANGE
jgi:hypothetical protein